VMDIVKLGYFRLADQRETRPSTLQAPLSGH